MTMTRTRTQTTEADSVASAKDQPLIGMRTIGVRRWALERLELTLYWSGIAATAVAVTLLKRGDGLLNKAMGRQQLHDLGKLTFAFCVFWTYLFFAQYLVIWYGKLPSRRGCASGT